MPKLTRTTLAVVNQIRQTERRKILARPEDLERILTESSQTNGEIDQIGLDNIRQEAKTLKSTIAGHKTNPKEVLANDVRLFQSNINRLLKRCPSTSGTNPNQSDETKRLTSRPPKSWITTHSLTKRTQFWLKTKSPKPGTLTNRNSPTTNRVLLLTRTINSDMQDQAATGNPIAR